MPEIEIASPKMLREALCALQSLLPPADDLRQGDKRRSFHKSIQDAIHAIDKVRPLAADGKHHELHTADCGCQDKKMNFCRFCKQRIIWGFGMSGWHWFHVESENLYCYPEYGDRKKRSEADPVQPAYLGKEHL